jgi:hypothetical protein
MSIGPFWRWVKGVIGFGTGDPPPDYSSSCPAEFTHGPSPVPSMPTLPQVPPIPSVTVPLPPVVPWKPTAPAPLPVKIPPALPRPKRPYCLHADRVAQTVAAFEPGAAYRVDPERAYFLDKDEDTVLHAPIRVSHINARKVREYFLYESLSGKWFYVMDTVVPTPYGSEVWRFAPWEVPDGLVPDEVKDRAFVCHLKTRKT